MPGSSERIIHVAVEHWRECGRQEGDGWVWLERGWTLGREHGSIRKRLVHEEHCWLSLALHGLWGGSLVR